MRASVRSAWERVTGQGGLRERIDALEAAQAGMEAAHHQTRLMAEELALHRDIHALDAVLTALPVSPGPTVSVVMATRDRADVLPRAIASVEAQTYPRWELVVVDDGSVDGTAELLAGLSDPRIASHRAGGVGCAAARNVGLGHARGEIVAYLDDDNLLHPRWLEAVVWAFGRRPDLQVLYGARIADDYGRTHRAPVTGTSWINLVPYDRTRLEQENLSDLGALAHRAGLPEARFDPTLVNGSDWDLLLRLTEAHDPLVLPAVACIYTTGAPDRLSDLNPEAYWDERVLELLDQRRGARS